MMMERISAMNIIIYGCKMAERHIHVDIGILLAANRQVITKWRKFPRFDAEILFESSIRSVFRFMDSMAHKYWIYQNFDDILVAKFNECDEKHTTNQTEANGITDNVQNKRLETSIHGINSTILKTGCRIFSSSYLAGKVSR